MDKLRVGVIGLGLWGQNHALSFADYHRSDLVAVCDLNEARAQEIGDRYGCKALTDYRAIADDPSITAVSIATPDSRHFEVTMAMLRAGKHVFVEKPFVTRTDEGIELVKQARASGVQAMVDFQLRWHPSYQIIKEEVASGRLGQPLMGYIRLSDAIDVALKWLPWAAESGPQWFLMPHIADLMYWFFGEVPESVYALGHRGVLRSQGVDTFDAVQTMLRFPSGGFATLETSWIVPNGTASVTDCQMALYGTQGRVEFDQDFAGLAITDASKISYPWVPLGRRNLFGRLDSFIYEPMRTFVDCVLEGRDVPSPFSEGLINTAIIEASLKSIESGAPEPVRGLDVMGVVHA